MGTVGVVTAGRLCRVQRLLEPYCLFFGIIQPLRIKGEGPRRPLSLILDEMIDVPLADPTSLASRFPHDDVTSYLLSPSLCAFQGRSRQLLLLSFHRLMASSTAALAKSLERVADRLRRMRSGVRTREVAEAATAVPTENLIRTVRVTDRADVGPANDGNVSIAAVHSVNVDEWLASFGRSSGRRAACTVFRRRPSMAVVRPRDDGSCGAGRPRAASP